MTENKTLDVQAEPQAQPETGEVPQPKTPSSLSGSETPPCSVCGSVEPADPRGLCPVKTCRAFRVGNKAAAIIGDRGKDFWKEQAGQLEQLRARFLADAGFASSDSAPLTLDIVAHSMAQAVVVRDAAFSHMTAAGGPLSESGKPRRAYTIWASSNEALIRDLRSAIAELATAPRPERSNNNATDQMPSSALHLAMDLLNREIAGEVLTDFERGQLAVLLAASHGKVLLPPDPADVPVFDAPANTRVDDGYMVREPGDVRYTEQEAIHATAAPKPTPAEPQCKYGCGTLAQCAEIKATRPEVWHTLHGLDPEVIKEKDAAATAEMLACIGRPHRAGDGLL